MKVFCNDTILEILPEDGPVPAGPQVYAFGHADAALVLKYYQMAVGGQVSGTAHFVFKSRQAEEVTKQFIQHLKLIKAAGGLVRKGNSYLLIHRLGKWDLPKGKVDPGETLEQAAVREVQEECNVEVRLGAPLLHTWHTYQFKNQHVLKQTAWYHMQCQSDRHMRPQLEEDIKQAKWMTPEQIHQTVLPDTYASIALVLQSGL